jgi:hypothetical protein
MTNSIETLINVSAKRWFDKSAGNTYHSVAVSISGINESLIEDFIPFTYGYDDAYRQTASDVILRLKPEYKDLLGDDAKYGLSYWRNVEALEKHGVKIVFSVYDVKRRKDL